MLDIPEFNLFIIRHGESHTNSLPDIMGQTAEDPLTELGREQAKKLGDLFLKQNINFDIAYSSHYTRAFHTAKLALPSTNITTCSDLREYDPGDWLGVKRSKVITPEIKLSQNYLNHNFQPPNGESLSQVERRVSKWLEDSLIYNYSILQWSKKLQRPLNVAIFSHGLTIKCLLQYVMGFDKAFTWKINIDNTSVSKLSFDKEGWRVLGINDCSHLI